MLVLNRCSCALIFLDGRCAGPAHACCCTREGGRTGRSVYECPREKSETRWHDNVRIRPAAALSVTQPAATQLSALRGPSGFLTLPACLNKCRGSSERRFPSCKLGEGSSCARHTSPHACWTEGADGRRAIAEETAAGRWSIVEETADGGRAIAEGSDQRNWYQAATDPSEILTVSQMIVVARAYAPAGEDPRIVKTESSYE